MESYEEDQSPRSHNTQPVFGDLDPMVTREDEKKDKLDYQHSYKHYKSDIRDTNLESGTFLVNFSDSDQLLTQRHQKSFQHQTFSQIIPRSELQYELGLSFNRFEPLFDEFEEKQQDKLAKPHPIKKRKLSDVNIESGQEDCGHDYNNLVDYQPAQPKAPRV